jgi:hypothetical protein
MEHDLNLKANEKIKEAEPIYEEIAEETYTLPRFIFETYEVPTRHILENGHYSPVADAAALASSVAGHPTDGDDSRL